MATQKGKGGIYPSEKLINFAKMISDELGVDIPGEAMDSTGELLKWIEEQSKDMPHDEEDKIIFKATMGQISFAEKLAQNGGIEVPTECYNNRKEMARWIDEHKDLGNGRPTEKMLNLAAKIYQKAVKEGKEIDDPAMFEEDFEGMKGWLDANFPPEWRK